MKINRISFNLFGLRNQNNTINANPFATQSANPFAGGLSNDIFQTNNINETKQNVFAQKAAELLVNWNKGIENIKAGTKEFFAPAISFAGSIKNGYEKLNKMSLADAYNNIKDRISLLTLDKDVRKYVNMPVADLKTELSKELSM